MIYKYKCTKCKGYSTYSEEYKKLILDNNISLLCNCGGKLEIIENIDNDEVQ